MNAAITIAPATRSDLGTIAAMIRALADYERLSDLCIATDQALDEALFAAQPAAEVLIGRVSGETAGFALFFHNFSTFLGRRGLWLEDLFVYPRFRGRGVGRSLLQAVGGIARERHCGRFEWAVLEWNEPAIRFYRSLGAIVMPDWRIARVTGPALESLGEPGSCPTAG